MHDDKQVSKNGEEKLELDWRNIGMIADLELKDTFMEMLSYFQPIRHGNLYQNSVPKFWIPGGRKLDIFWAVTGALQSMRTRRKHEIDKMASEGAIERAQAEWVTQTVFTSTKQGTSCFCVDYQKLRALMTLHVNLTPKKEEFKYFSWRSRTPHWATCKIREPSSQNLGRRLRGDVPYSTSLTLRLFMNAILLTEFSKYVPAKDEPGAFSCCVAPPLSLSKQFCRVPSH